MLTHLTLISTIVVYKSLMENVRRAGDTEKGVLFLYYGRAYVQGRCSFPVDNEHMLHKELPKYNFRVVANPQYDPDSKPHSYLLKHSVREVFEDEHDSLTEHKIQAKEGCYMSHNCD